MLYVPAADLGPPFSAFATSNHHKDHRQAPENSAMVVSSIDYDYCDEGADDEALIWVPSGLAARRGRRQKEWRPLGTRPRHEANKSNVTAQLDCTSRIPIDLRAADTQAKSASHRNWSRWRSRFGARVCEAASLAFSGRHDNQRRFMASTVDTSDAHLNMKSVGRRPPIGYN